jgi:hypothetical protein
MDKKHKDLEALLQQLPADELGRHAQLLRAFAKVLPLDTRQDILRFVVSRIEQAAKTASTVDVEMPAQAPVDRTKWPSLDEIQWPTEKYKGSEEYKLAQRKRGEGGIVLFLERVWYPPILKPYPGLVTFRMLKRIDLSAANAIANHKRKKDLLTGENLKIPSHLEFPLIMDENDKFLQRDTISIKDVSRLRSAARRRGLHF